jgi:hypothetical protein
MAEMSKHTPGEWVKASDSWWIVGADGGPVSTVDYALRDEEEATANARLIAAAPTMASLLDRVRSHLGEYPSDGKMLRDINATLEFIGWDK